MTIPEILDAIRRVSALVVGDICLDRWCTYDPAAAELSRETGIPRIAVTSTEVTAGAGGTVANNLRALGAASVAVMGVIGDDGHGAELRAALCARGIDARYLVADSSLQTFTYTKLIDAASGIEDLPRVDFINTSPLAGSAEQKILDNLGVAIPAFDVILISDQAETGAGGVVTPRVRNRIAEAARAFPNKIFFVDSRKRIELFRHAVLKPNREEADAACRRLYGALDYPRLRRDTRAELLIVTLGADGALVVGEDGERPVPATSVAHPVDICGAGDSFSAGAVLALAAGASGVEAAALGNLVASITIMKKGTGTASPEEVLAAAARQSPSTKE